ncbi:MAG: hypothetical protein AAFX99_09065 [Myxococcota bacterium]
MGQSSQDEFVNACESAFFESTLPGFDMAPIGLNCLEPSPSPYEGCFRVCDSFRECQEFQNFDPNDCYAACIDEAWFASDDGAMPDIGCLFSTVELGLDVVCTERITACLAADDDLLAVVDYLGLGACVPACAHVVSPEVANSFCGVYRDYITTDGESIETCLEQCEGEGEEATEFIYDADCLAQQSDLPDAEGEICQVLAACRNNVCAQSCDLLEVINTTAIGSCGAIVRDTLTGTQDNDCSVQCDGGTFDFSAECLSTLASSAEVDLTTCAQAEDCIDPCTVTCEYLEAVPNSTCSDGSEIIRYSDLPSCQTECLGTMFPYDNTCIVNARNSGIDPTGEQGCTTAKGCEACAVACGYILGIQANTTCEGLTNFDTAEACTTACAGAEFAYNTSCLLDKNYNDPTMTCEQLGECTHSNK